MLKVRFAPLVALVCALALPAAAHAATTWTVDPAAASDCAGTTCKTIQGAVTNAAAGDVINVHAGGYVQAVTIGKSLTINGAPGAIVSAPAGSVPLSVTGGTVTLSNLSVLSAGADTVLVSSSATADVTVNSSLLVGSGGTAASLHAVSGGTLTGGTVTVTANHVTTAGQAYGAWAQDAATASGTATVAVHNSIVHGTAATHTTPCAVILVCVATVDTTDHVDTATPDGTQFGSSFHLKRGSPAIDQGADTPAAGATDIDGQPRVIGAKSDLGADEYDDVTSTTPSLTATPATASPGQSVAFQASAAPGQPTLGVDHYVISYGDGSPAATTSGAGAHAYAVPGSYKATAVAVGRSGAVSPAGTATVTVSGGGGGPGGGNSSGACSGGFTQPNGAPTVAITSPRSGKVLKRKKTIRRHHKKVKVLNPPRVRGVACDTDGVRSVQLAVLYLGRHSSVSLGGRCNAFDGKRKFKRVTCTSSPFFAAKISDFDWSFKFSSKSKLKAGYYAVFARATDDKAHTSAVLSKQAKTLSVFRLK
jgi:PKD domain